MADSVVSGYLTMAKASSFWSFGALQEKQMNVRYTGIPRAGQQTQTGERQM